MKYVLLLASLTFGCASGPKPAVPDGPSMNARRYAKLQKMAAKDLSCDAASLSHKYEGENQHRMTGCGKDAVFELRCMVGSCSWIQDVRKRAEFDLGCTRPEIQVTRLGPNSRGVTGCGKKATYILGPMNGEWILNNVAEEGPATPQPRDDNTPKDI